MGILHLGARQRVRLFVRRDTFDRFVSCLVFVPRDRFNTENRRRIERILRRADRGDQHRLHDARLRVGAGAAALPRLRRSPASCPSSTSAQIETLLVAATRSWGDDLEEALHRGVRRGARRAAVPALRRRVPGRLPRRLGAALGGGRHRPHRGARRARRPVAAPLPAARGARRARCARRCSAPARRWRCPTCCRCSRTWACRSPTSAPTRSRPREREGVWIYDFGLTYAGRRASSRPTACGTPSRTPSSTPGAATPRTTATTASSCAPG